MKNAECGTKNTVCVGRLFAPTLLLALLLIPALSFAAETALFKGSETTPADAVVLFDGEDISGWVDDTSVKPAEWKVADGYMEITSGSIMTKKQFGDCQLHVEFWLPLMADRHGQGRANSGVYVEGRYEIQVLDSYGLKSGDGDCGAVYGIAPPLVNACRPPETWQSYDIIFHTAKCDDKGKKTDSPRMTVLHNGIVIHDNLALPFVCGGAVSGEEGPTGPLLLQDHGCPIRYRNIWYRPLK